jgi:hypothetical protein
MPRTSLVLPDAKQVSKLRGNHCYKNILVQTDIKYHQERGQIWEHEHGEEMIAYMCHLWRNLASVLPKIQTRYAAVTRQCFNGPWGWNPVP